MTGQELIIKNLLIYSCPYFFVEVKFEGNPINITERLEKILRQFPMPESG
jgi:hypothetical protein